MNKFKSFILVVLAVLITANTIVATNVISLEDAARKGLIKLIIKSKGGFTGEVIEMKIKNVSAKILNLMMEAGRRLDSKKNCEQDILVTKPEEFVLIGNQSKTLNVFGMCCQAHNSCPAINADYSIGSMADTSLIKLANFIDKNKYYTSSTAQQAVWVVSDNNSIGSITDGENEIVDNLRKYVSKITGKIIPAYEVSYVRESANEVQGRVNKIEGIFDYELPANGHVTIGIYNSDGHLVQLLFENYAHEKGNYKLYFTLRAKDLERGTYYARMKTEGVGGKEMKIEF